MGVIAIPAGRCGKGHVEILEPYVDAIVAAGGLPVLVPAIEGVPSRLDPLWSVVEGIMITGGGDIHPQCYGQSAQHSLGAVDEDRDALELAMLDWSLSSGVRVLGICRGAQIMGVHAGCALIQDLPSEGLHGHKDPRVDAGYTAKRHAIDVDEDSRTARLLGDIREVNSEHHQAIRACTGGLRPVAWSTDGVIEAVERDAWLGVQWHPEYMTTEGPQHLDFFRWLVHGDEGIEALR